MLFPTSLALYEKDNHHITIPVVKLLHGLVELGTCMPAEVNSIDEVLGSAC